MIENCKSNLNKRSKKEAIILDLFNAFCILDHSLLIAKREAYDFYIVYI